MCMFSLLLFVCTSTMQAKYSSPFLPACLACLLAWVSAMGLVEVLQCQSGMRWLNRLANMQHKCVYKRSSSSSW